MRPLPWCCPALPEQSLGRDAYASPLSRSSQLPIRSNTGILAQADGCCKGIAERERDDAGGRRTTRVAVYCIAFRYG